jgi:hypothetical protein
MFSRTISAFILGASMLLSLPSGRAAERLRRRYKDNSSLSQIWRSTSLNWKTFRRGFAAVPAFQPRQPPRSPPGPRALPVRRHPRARVASRHA